MSEKVKRAVQAFFSDIEERIKIEEMKVTERLEFLKDLHQKICGKVHYFSFVFSSNLPEHLKKIQLIMSPSQWEIRWDFSNDEKKPEFDRLDWQGIALIKMNYENDITWILERLINREYDETEIKTIVPEKHIQKFQ